MKYFLKLLLLTALSLFIISCGSEESNTIASTKINVLSTKSTLNPSKTKMNINFLVRNNYSSDVSVSLTNLDVDISPCKVLSSSFTPHEVLFSNEKEKEVRVSLIFTEECNPSTYQLKGTTVLTLDGARREANLDSSAQDITPSLVLGVSNENNSSNGSSGNIVNDNNSSVIN